MPQDLPSSLWAFFWYNLRSHRYYAYGLMLTGVLWGSLLSLVPYVLKCIIDIVAKHPRTVEQGFHAVLPYCFIYIALWVLEAANFRINDWLRLKLFPDFRRNIIDNMFSYVSRHSHSYFENQFAGSLSNKISDMSGSSVGILTKLDEAFAQLIALVIAGVMMFLVNPLFSGILLGWATILLAISYVYSKRALLYSDSFSESKSVLSGKIVDSITNYKNVHAFARHHFENQRLRLQIKDTVTKDRRMQRYILKMRIVQDVSFISLMAAMLFGLVYLYLKQKVTVGDFILILTVSLSIAQAMWWLSNQMVQFAEELGRCTQALTIVTKQHDIKDLPNAKPLAVKEGAICFHAVDFAYIQGKPLFENFRLKLPAKKCLGVVGYSGSGKSTLVSLLMRFFLVDKGEVLIDGQNVNEVTEDSLRRDITFLQQDVSLFHRTLRENIRYGRIDASDEEVEIAAKKAMADSFIRQLPLGYDTLVGERGVKLSGGQRQRIALARALLKKAPILILDEATSALDSVTEAAIANSLVELIKDKTSIIIAHRLSTLRMVDEIVVLDEGKIVESGTHDDLLALGGQYARMWQMQSNGFLQDVNDGEATD